MQLSMQCLSWIVGTGLRRQCGKTRQRGKTPEPLPQSKKDNHQPHAQWHLFPMLGNLKVSYNYIVFQCTEGLIWDFSKCIVTMHGSEGVFCIVFTESGYYHFKNVRGISTLPVLHPFRF